MQNQPLLSRSEEEDEYDKVGIGKENSGERLYWKDVNDYGVDINTFHELPDGFKDVAKDPRANHLAAKLRLKEDSQTTGGSHELELSETSQANVNSLSNAEVATASPLDNIGSHGDCDGGLENPKPILKNNKIYNQSVCRSHKRVRFKPQFDASSNNTRGQNQEPSKALTITGDGLVSSSSISTSEGPRIAPSSSRPEHSSSVSSNSEIGIVASISESRRISPSSSIGSLSV